MDQQILRHLGASFTVPVGLNAPDDCWLFEQGIDRFIFLIKFDGGFHRKLYFQLPPPDVGNCRKLDAVRLDSENTNFCNSASPGEV